MHRGGPSASGVASRPGGAGSLGPIVLVLVSAGFSTLTISQARAQSREVELTVSSVYDDNLFRLPEAEKELQPHSGKEVSTLLSANMLLNARLGLIDVVADGGIAGRFYANNSEFDSEEYRASLRAEYSAVSGSAQVEALLSRQNLSFVDPLYRGTNIRSLERVDVRGDRRLISDFYVAGSVRVSSSSSPDEDLRGADSTIYAYSAGIDYVSPIDNRVGVKYSETRSEGGDGVQTVIINGIPVLYSPESTDRSAYGEIIWTSPETYSLQGRAGYTWHDDRSPRDMDVKDFTYDVTATWSPLRTLTISLATQRSFSSNDELFSNGVDLTTYTAGLDATAFGRLSLNATIERARREFRFLPQGGVNDTMARTDRFWVYRAGASYRLGAGFDVGLMLSRVAIADSALAENITANSVMLTLAKSFQF